MLSAKDNEWQLPPQDKRVWLWGLEQIFLETRRLRVGMKVVRLKPELVMLVILGQQVGLNDRLEDHEDGLRCM